jgi:hypothetical protein
MASSIFDIITKINSLDCDNIPDTIREQIPSIYKSLFNACALLKSSELIDNLSKDFDKAYDKHEKNKKNSKDKNDCCDNFESDPVFNTMYDHMNISDIPCINCKLRYLHHLEKLRLTSVPCKSYEKCVGEICKNCKFDASSHLNSVTYNLLPEDLQSVIFNKFACRSLLLQNEVIVVLINSCIRTENYLEKAKILCAEREKKFMR